MTFLYFFQKAEKGKDQVDDLQDANYQWCPVNSQGLKWHDLTVRKQKNEDKRIETARDVSMISPQVNFFCRFTTLLTL